MDIRERINRAAGRKQELAREILGLDWFDVESQARRVIDWIEQKECIDANQAPVPD